jgi:hypothetical protein
LEKLQMDHIQRIPDAERNLNHKFVHARKGPNEAYHVFFGRLQKIGEVLDKTSVEMDVQFDAALSALDRRLLTRCGLTAASTAEKCGFLTGQIQQDREVALELERERALDVPAAAVAVRQVLAQPALQLPPLPVASSAAAPAAEQGELRRMTENNEAWRQGVAASIQMLLPAGQPFRPMNEPPLPQRLPVAATQAPRPPRPPRIPRQCESCTDPHTPMMCPNRSPTLNCQRCNARGPAHGGHATFACPLEAQLYNSRCSICYRSGHNEAACFQRRNDLGTAAAPTAAPAGGAPRVPHRAIDNRPAWQGGNAGGGRGFAPGHGSNNGGGRGSEGGRAGRGPGFR